MRHKVHLHNQARKYIWAGGRMGRLSTVFRSLFRRRFAVLFRSLAGFLEGAGGVFVGLAGKFMGSQAALTMRSCSGGVGMGGKIVVFGGAIVWALGHRSSPLAG
jgi:hypothetical protein